MRVLVIWTFFLLKPGFGHEEFSAIKVGGFALILTGVLFFNKIFVFDGLRIKFQGGEDEATRPLEYMKNSSDEDLSADRAEGGLPRKLELDENEFDETTSSSRNG